MEVHPQQKKSKVSLLSGANFTNAAHVNKTRDSLGSTIPTSYLSHAQEDAESGAIALLPSALLLGMMLEQLMTTLTTFGLKSLSSSGSDGSIWTLVKMSLTNPCSMSKDGAKN